MISISENKRNWSVYSRHTLAIENNRKYMKILVDIVLFVSCRGIGFRGHGETKDSLNQGIKLMSNK